MKGLNLIDAKSIVEEDPDIDGSDLTSLFYVLIELVLERESGRMNGMEGRNQSRLID